MLTEETEAIESLFRRVRSCPICGADGAEMIRQEANRFAIGGDLDKVLLTLRGDRNLAPVPQLRFCFLDELPARTEFYERLYGVGRYDYEFEFNHHGKRAIYADLKKRITRYQPSGRLLDIGCWCGTLLAAMADTYDVVGSELSEPAALFARSLGFDVRISPFQQSGFDRESFDVVTIIDVLEHLTEPLEVLRSISELLKPGGLVYIKVPSITGQIRKQDLLQRLRLSREGVCTNFVHINHFSHRSLSYGLSHLGFQIVEKGFTKPETWDLRVPRPLAKKAKLWLVNQVRNAGTELTSLVDRLTPWDVGLNIYVIAQKPVKNT